MTEDDLERIMSQYDANRDGVIQFEEYTKMVGLFWSMLLTCRIVLEYF